MKLRRVTDLFPNGTEKPPVKGSARYPLLSKFEERPFSWTPDASSEEKPLFIKRSYEARVLSIKKPSLPLAKEHSSVGMVKVDEARGHEES